MTQSNNSNHISQKMEYIMAGFGWQELLIVLVIIVVLFGVGRIGKIAGELGGGIRSFRDGLKGDDDKKKDQPEENDASQDK